MEVNIGIAEEDRMEIVAGLSKLLVQRMQVHGKTAWMLRSLLDTK